MGRESTKVDIRLQTKHQQKKNIDIVRLNNRIVKDRIEPGSTK